MNYLTSQSPDFKDCLEQSVNNNGQDPVQDQRTKIPLGVRKEGYASVKIKKAEIFDGIMPTVLDVRTSTEWLVILEECSLAPF